MLFRCTGSYPFVPPLPGKDRKDTFVYRTIEDLEAMLECGQRAKSGVVVGGGLLGLECAKALRDIQGATDVEKKEDVVTLPKTIAQILVDRGKARIVQMPGATA